MNPIPLHHVWNYTDVDRRFWKEQLEEWVPHEVFDAHIHVNEPRFRPVEPTEAQRHDYWVYEVNDPIGADDTERCSGIVYPGREFSCMAFGHPSLEYDVEASNADLQQQASRRGWLSLAVTRPQWSQEKISALLDQPGVCGVKVYSSLIGPELATREQQIEASIYDFLPHHQLSVLNARRAWLTLHVPKAERLGHPDNIREIREIRERYPDIILVIAHLGRSYTLLHAEESLPQLARDDGIYFDNSAVLNPDVHRFALDLLGPDRILYGTDNPIFYMRGRRQWKGRTYINRTSYPFYFNTDRESPEIEAGYTLFMYEALRALKDAANDVGFSASDVERLFSGNARRLLSLKKEHTAM